MMNAKRILIMVCLLLSAAGTLLAQGHWPAVNPHDYQYDMTAYVQLTTASAPITNTLSACQRARASVGIRIYQRRSIWKSWQS